jgi:hypothetical protein
MKILIKIYIVLLSLLLIGYTGTAQVSSGKTDTLKIKTSVATENQEVQNQNATSGNAVKAVKQVRNARPDLTRMSGARPPVITRPSGGGIPKGAGRPGGAGPKGGR